MTGSVGGLWGERAQRRAGAHRCNKPNDEQGKSVQQVYKGGHRACLTQRQRAVTQDWAINDARIYAAAGFTDTLTDRHEHEVQKKSGDGLSATVVTTIA